MGECEVEREVEIEDEEDDEREVELVTVDFYVSIMWEKVGGFGREWVGEDDDDGEVDEDEDESWEWPIDAGESFSFIVPKSFGK